MRKRRTKYEWFLNVGTTGPAGDVEDDSSGRDFFLTVPVNGTTTAGVFEVIEDTPSDDQAVGLPMGFYQNNEYIIKRIVGKLFAQVTQVANATNPPAVLLGAGFFVARTEDADSGGPTLPIGASTAAQTVDNYSPLRVENIREPWIWRRTWVLSNVLSTAAAGLQVGAFGRATSDYGSVMDGPHIDAKSVRRVKDGERLWFALAARNYTLNSTCDTSAVVTAHLDYRVLGRRARRQGKSSF